MIAFDRCAGVHGVIINRLDTDSTHSEGACWIDLSYYANHLWYDILYEAVWVSVEQHIDGILSDWVIVVGTAHSAQE